MTSISFKKYVKIISVVCLVIIVSAIASHAYAVQVDSTYTPLAPLPNLTTSTVTSTDISFSTYVTYVFNLLIALGAVAAVFMITWGGFEYMTSDAVQGKSAGLAKIKNAIYGLILVLSSLLILRTINPQFAEVPATLVPAANLTQPTKDHTVSGWQNQLDKISSQYQDQSNAAIADKYAAKSTVADLQSQLTTAQYTQSLACADSANVSTKACSDATNSVNSLQDQLNTANSKLAVTQSTANTSGILNTINSGGQSATGSTTTTFQAADAATLQKAQDANTTSYTNAVAAINANGSNPQALQLVQQQTTIARDEIVIQQEYDNINSGTLTSDQKTVAINQIQTAQAEMQSTKTKMDTQITDANLQSSKTITDSSATTANQHAQVIIDQIQQNQQTHNSIDSSSAAY